MKIFFKKGRKTYNIRFPAGIIRLIPARLLTYTISKNSEDEFIKQIDFKQLKKALYMLNEYKGLNLVEIKSAKGEELIIRI